MPYTKKQKMPDSKIENAGHKNRKCRTHKERKCWTQKQNMTGIQNEKVPET